MTGTVKPLEVRLSGLDSGRNNSVAIYEGLQTRMNNGHVSEMRLRYAVTAGKGEAAGGIVQDFTGTLASGAYQKLAD